MFLRIGTFLIAIVLAGIAVPAGAQDGHYWNGAPYGAGQYPWEQGGSGRHWNNDGDWNSRHHGQHDYSNRPRRNCTSGSGAAGSPSGVTICQ